MYYTGELSIGTKNNTFNLIFDTGSTLIFVNSIYCDDLGCLKGHNYDQTKSPTYVDLLSEVEVSFGSGILKGSMGQDTFYLD